MSVVLQLFGAITDPTNPINFLALTVFAMPLIHEESWRNKLINLRIPFIRISSKFQCICGFSSNFPDVLREISIYNASPLSTRSKCIFPPFSKYSSIFWWLRSFQNSEVCILKSHRFSYRFANHCLNIYSDSSK